MVFRPRKFDIHTAKVYLARYYMEAVVRRRLNLFEESALTKQDPVSARAFYLFQAHSARRVRLGIEIKQQNPAT
jgi:hypothetical protein